MLTTPSSRSPWKRLRAWLAACVAFVLLAPSGALAQQSTDEDWKRSIEQRLERLEEGLTRLLDHLDRTDEEPDAESAREQAAALVEEGQRLADDLSAPSPGAEAPVEAKRLPYGGYMELHFNDHEVSGTSADFHRFVLLFGHDFSDKVRFVGELELEHALVEGGGEQAGELELEQAYLDFQLSPSLSARAGMMLVPIGIINERHEPASFHGVERPFVDTFIVPSTWFSNGFGLTGRFGSGFSFKTFLMSSLDASMFSAGEGLRDGRQKGFEDDFSDPAVVARLEYSGVPGLSLGGTYWTGKTGFGFEPLQIDGNTKILEVDAQYAWRRFQLKGQYATTEFDDAGIINRALQGQTGIQPNLAEEMNGHYLEAAYHLFPRRIRNELALFYRYEDFDTQHKMPAGFLPITEFKRDAHVLGLTFFPLPDVAIKADYNFMGNDSNVVEALDTWNVGIGWWF
ncbi:MAG: hypothetical protein VYE73_02885 [Acidobacteriota bacterium]|nr:hypothetical protein [Acidobacteriota bacterium]